MIEAGNSALTSVDSDGRNRTVIIPKSDGRLSNKERALSGTLTDTVVRPNGSSTSVAATLNDAAWMGAFVFDQNSVYQVIAVATDVAGNKTTQVLGEITATNCLQTPTPTATLPPVTATPRPSVTPTATQGIPVQARRLFLPLVQRQNPPRSGIRSSGTRFREAVPYVSPLRLVQFVRICTS